MTLKKISLFILFLILSLIFVGCFKHYNLKDSYALEKLVVKEQYRLKIIDSISIDSKRGIYDEYLPISVSPSKQKLMIVKNIGSKQLILYNLIKKTTRFLIIVTLKMTLFIKKVFIMQVF